MIGATILYAGDFLFPEGGPSAARVIGIGKACVLGGTRWSSRRGSDAEARGSRLGRGLRVSGLPLPVDARSTVLSRLPAALPRQLVAGGVEHDTLAPPVSASPPCRDHQRERRQGYLLRLLPFCRKSRIPLFMDVMEWFDPDHFPGGKFGPRRSRTT